MNKTYYLYRQRAPRALAAYRDSDARATTFIVTGIIGGVYLFILLLIWVDPDANVDGSTFSLLAAATFGPALLCEAATLLGTKSRIRDVQARGVYKIWRELPVQHGELKPLYDKIMRDAREPNGVMREDLDLFYKTAVAIRTQHELLSVEAPDPARAMAEDLLKDLTTQNSIYAEDHIV